MAALALTPFVNNQNIVLVDERFRLNGLARDTNLKLFNMYNYIFRGDDHSNPVLGPRPKFYGTLTSAFGYANPYLKIYQPVKQLKLLYLNFTASNVLRIFNMIQDMITFFTTNQRPNDVQVLKFVYIMLQVNFGLIVPPQGHASPYFCAINKMGYTNEYIRDGITHYSGHDSAGQFVYNLIRACESNQNVTVDGQQISSRQLIGSRVSIRPMDQWIMSQFANYLPYFFGIEGVVFDDSSMAQNLPFVCKYANGIYGGQTCVPTEIVIFNPDASLNAPVMIRKNQANQLERSANQAINQMLSGIQGLQLIGGSLESDKYHRLYLKYKAKYLDLKNKQN